MCHIVPFQFQTREIRTVILTDKPWFVAKDVCDILELGNITEALCTLDDDELTSELLKSGSQRRKMKLVNESGLYALIFKSRKPEAKAFRKWVTSEVLPALRKTGRYAVPPAPKGGARPDGRPGPEWRTMQEIASAWDMPRRNAALRVTAMTRKGEVEVQPSKNPWQPYYYRFVNLPGPPAAPSLPAPQKHRYFRGAIRPDGSMEFAEYDPAREFWEIPRWLLEDAYFTDGSRELRDNKELLLEIAHVATMRARYGCAEARRRLDGAAEPMPA